MKSDELTRLQQQALPYLLDSHTIEEAARRAGVSKKQIFTWLKQPKFKAELERLRTEILNSAIDKLRLGATKATGVIVEALGSVNENIRLKAADQLLSNLIKLTELAKIEGRISMLEQTIGG